MARVLFTACPLYGHVLPMLPLMRSARDAGHDVRVATGTDLHDPLVGRGLDAHVIGPMFPFYAHLIGPAGAVNGEPGLWEQASSERALDICPPSRARRVLHPRHRQEHRDR